MWSWLMLWFSMRATPVPSLYNNTWNVAQLTSENFDHLVLNSSDLWIVQFYINSSPICQAFEPEYKETANVLAELAKVGVVDAEEYPNLTARYSISDFPAVKIFRPENKSHPEDFTGAKTAEALVEQTIPSNDVVVLTDENFDQVVLASADRWLVFFYAPWCVFSKALLPHWSIAASELKDKIHLAKLDVTKNDEQKTKYKVESWPSFRYFPPGNKTADSAETDNVGGNSNGIAIWVHDKLNENAPVPEIHELRNEAIFEGECRAKAFCVIAILPKTSEKRENYLGIFKEVAVAYRTKLWGWVWMEQGVQSALENAIEVEQDLSEPTVAVLDTKTVKYALKKSWIGYNVQVVSSFLRYVVYGSVMTVPIRGDALPKIEQATGAEKEVDLTVGSSEKQTENPEL